MGGIITDFKALKTLLTKSEHGFTGLLEISKNSHLAVNLGTKPHLNFLYGKDNCTIGFAMYVNPDFVNENILQNKLSLILEIK